MVSHFFCHWGAHLETQDSTYPRPHSSRMLATIPNPNTFESEILVVSFSDLFILQYNDIKKCAYQIINCR